ncbi:hypothetical protein MRX96_051645 [Rhipicephalus microplus]
MVCIAMYVVFGLMAIFLLVVLVNSFTGWHPSSPRPLVPVNDRTARAKHAPYHLLIDGREQAAATPPTSRRGVRRRRVRPVKITPQSGDLVGAFESSDRVDASKRGVDVEASKPGGRADTSEPGDLVRASKPGDHADASERGDDVETETSTGG